MIPSISALLVRAFCKRSYATDPVVGRSDYLIRILKIISAAAVFQIAPVPSV